LTRRSLSGLHVGELVLVAVLSACQIPARAR